MVKHVSRSRRIFAHVAFWIGVLAFYTLYFGSREDEYGQAFLFVILLLPITVTTTYFILYVLIPKYAMTNRYGLFSLYLMYTLLFSIYAELILLVGLYITVSDYQALFVRPAITDQLEVLAGMYLVVLIAIAARMWNSLRNAREENERLALERNEIEARLRIAEMRLHGDVWQVRANRQTYRIPTNEIRFIESVRDYVKIHRNDGVLVSKMKLRDAEEELEPAGLIRAHRSYLVNPLRIDSWSSDSVVIGDDVIPVGRSFRKRVSANLSDEG